MSGSGSEIFTTWEAREWERAFQESGQGESVSRKLAHTAVKVSEERDWLAKALQDQEQAYAALEAQFLAVSDAHAALVDQISALAAGAIR